MPECMFSSCLYFSTNRLTRAMNKLAEEEFSKAGVAPTYAFLLILVHQQPGITPSELAENLHMAPSTITRFVDKLIVKNLVTKQSEGKNSYIYLTDKGKDIQEQLNGHWKNLNEAYSQILGEAWGYELTSNISKAARSIETKIK